MRSHIYINERQTFSLCFLQRGVYQTRHSSSRRQQECATAILLLCCRPLACCIVSYNILYFISAILLLLSIDTTPRPTQPPPPNTKIKFHSSAQHNTSAGIRLVSSVIYIYFQICGSPRGVFNKYEGSWLVVAPKRMKRRRRRRARSSSSSRRRRRWVVPLRVTIRTRYSRALNPPLSTRRHAAAPDTFLPGWGVAVQAAPPP